MIRPQIPHQFSKYFSRLHFIWTDVLIKYTEAIYEICWGFASIFLWGRGIGYRVLYSEFWIPDSGRWMIAEIKDQQILDPIFDLLEPVLMKKGSALRSFQQSFFKLHTCVSRNYVLQYTQTFFCVCRFCLCHGLKKSHEFFVSNTGLQVRQDHRAF